MHAYVYSCVSNSDLEDYGLKPAVIKGISRKYDHESRRIVGIDDFAVIHKIDLCSDEDFKGYIGHPETNITDIPGAIDAIGKLNGAMSKLLQINNAWQSYVAREEQVAKQQIEIYAR